MVDLSISIVAYNDYDDVLQAVKTLEKYTSNQIKKRIYVIDNSINYQSVEKSRKKLIEYISLMEDIEYINVETNLGFGRGHNYVLPVLDSKYHAIVNPDIVFVEDVFKGIITYMNNTDIGMCIPKLIDEKGNMQLAYRREITLLDLFIRMFCKNLFKGRIKKHTMQDMDFSKPFQVPFGQGSFLVIRTDLFRKLKGFDDRYFMYLEDADLCKRVNQVSKLVYFPEVTVIHKWKKESSKNWRLFKIHFGSMYKYFKKWGIKFL